LAQVLWVGQVSRRECSYVPRSAPKRSLRVGYLAREGIDERPEREVYAEVGMPSSQT